MKIQHYFLLSLLAIFIGYGCGSAAKKSTTTTTTTENTNKLLEEPEMIQDQELLAAKSQLTTFLANEGIEYKTAKEGFHYSYDTLTTAAAPENGKYVSVHYVGTTLDGTKFDSSRDRNEPFLFKIGEGRVIQGWDLGIPMFNVGSKGKLYLPPDMAYGPKGAGGTIGAYENLIFEIEVLAVLTEEEYIAEQEAIKAEKMKAFQVIYDKQMEVDNQIIIDYAKANNLELNKSESGLHFIVEEEGEGPKAVAGDVVVVHYLGQLLDGTKFDSSYDRNDPIRFQLGQQRVIQGWDEGLTFFNKGSKGKLLIPSMMGYGPRGAGGSIPPNAVLLFDVELIDIK